MVKYLSGRQKRRPQDQLTEDRYKYLGLDQAEPNLSDPLVSPGVPSGTQYQLVAVPGYPGQRYWVPVGGAVVPGAITIFDEGTPVSAASSITQVNFVGAAVTAQVTAQSPSGHPGIAATVTVIPVNVGDNPPNNPSPNTGELWWESDTGDLYVYYNDGDSAQWVMANSGGRGLPGTDGDKGQKGEKGEKGEIGLTGSQGQKGEIGIGQKGEPSTVKGDKGEKGQKGEIGEKGNIGDKGAQSTVEGPKGQKGDKGEEGEKGAGGVKGDKGQKGDKGEQGDKGQKGQKGAKGEVGADSTVPGDKGQKGEQGNFGGATFDYTFSSSTGTPTDLNTGRLRLNNSTVSSATIMFIDDEDDNGTDIQAFLRTIDDSTSTIKGHVRISNKLNADDFAIFTISSASEQSGFHQVNVGYVSGSATSFSNGEDIIVTFARTGDLGDKGAKGEPSTVKGQGGDKGDKGQKGDDNSTKGDKGAPGADNSTKGDKGDAIKGEKGQKGQKGEQGTSIKGEPGADNSTKGQKGAPGADNSTKGDKGQKGDQGSSIKGEPGADNSTKGQKGEAGADNSTKGQKGEQGQKGQTGADNSTKGQKGAPGADNSTKGQKGEVGNQGTPAISNESSSSYRNLVFIDSSSATTIKTNDNNRLQVRSSDGALRVAGDITAFYSSDINLKENITPIPNALDKIIAISGNTFTWKADTGFDYLDNKQDTGVIAQEIEALGLPGITTTRDNGVKAVRYERLVPILIEAIKELKKEINEIKNTE